MKHVIGDREFKTKTECMRYVKEYLKESPNNVEVTNDPFFIGLLKNHYDRTVLENHKKIFIKDTINIYGATNRNIVVLFKDGTEAPVSYKKCVNGLPPTEKARTKRDYRESVIPQTNKFRSKDKSKECELCGVSFRECETHVDHILPFRDIVKKYEEELADGMIDEEFKYYHERVATLRVICKDCNLKRG